MHLPRLLAGGAVAAVVTVTAACGMQAASPKIELRDAARAFAAADSGTLELSIGSSADDVRAFTEAVEPTTGGAGMTDDDLEQLLSSSIEIGYDLGADRDSDADDANSVVVNLGDLEAGEIRYLDQLAYVRVDVEGLAEKFPDMQEGLDSFRAGLTGADGVSEPAPPSVVEPATALLDGEWVSVDVQAYLDQLAQMAPSAEGDPSAGLSAETSAKARDLFGSALKDAVGAVERRESDDELGDHLVASLDLRKAWTKLRSGLPELLEGTTGESADTELPSVDEVPDKQVPVSFWVRDGALTRVELDLADFLDKPAGHLVLRADVRAEQEITAPSGAVEFDFDTLLAGMPVGGVEGEGDPAAEIVPDAYTVATWVDMDIAARAAEDGAQPSALYLPTLLPDYAGMAPGLLITAVGERIQVVIEPDVVCLTVSADGMGENIAAGPC